MGLEMAWTGNLRHFLKCLLLVFFWLDQRSTGNLVLHPVCSRWKVPTPHLPTSQVFYPIPFLKIRLSLTGSCVYFSLALSFPGCGCEIGK